MRRRGIAVPLALSFALTACHPANTHHRDANAVPGGTLRIAVRDLATLDPAQATSRGSLQAIGQLFDPLTRIDSRTGEVGPGVASGWTSTPDLKSWTFHIGSSRYSDGRPVTAGDFKFAFDRLARHDIASDAAFQFDQVAGFREERLLGTATSLAGVVAHNDTTLTFTLTHPFAEFPFMLAHPALVPLERTRYRNGTAKLATDPIGNGPFRVVTGPPSKVVTLARNDSYTGATALLDAVEFDVVPDLADAAQQYRDGKVDITDVPGTFIDTVGNGSSDGETPLWAMLSFGPNLKLAKYASVKVRRALSLAIDRKAIADTVYGGTKDPATGIVPRGVRGFKEAACVECAFSPDYARTLLRAGTNGGTLSLTIDHLDDVSSRRVAQAVGADLTAIGVKVAYHEHAPAEYLTLLQRGGQDFAQLGWLADVPTPDGFLAEQLRTGSLNNQTAFSDNRFDSLVDQARAQANEPARLQLYGQAEQEALTLKPLIPVVFFRNHTAVAKRVHGFLLDGAGVFDGGDVWLAR